MAKLCPAPVPDTGVIHGEREVPEVEVGRGAGQQPPLFLPHHIRFKEGLCLGDLSLARRFWQSGTTRSFAFHLVWTACKQTSTGIQIIFVIFALRRRTRKPGRCELQLGGQPGDNAGLWQQLPLAPALEGTLTLWRG